MGEAVDLKVVFKVCFLIFFLGISKAFACPNLSGSYAFCTSGNSEMDVMLEISSKVRISQKMINGKMSYLIKDEKEEVLYVEGVERLSTTPLGDEIDGVLLQVKKTPLCKPSQLVLKHLSELIKSPTSRMSDEEFNEIRTTFTEVLGNFEVVVKKKPNQGLLITQNFLGKLVRINCKNINQP